MLGTITESMIHKLKISRKLIKLKHNICVCGELSEACISAADVSIPFTCNQKIAGRLPGWSEQCPAAAKG